METCMFLCLHVNSFHATYNDVIVGVNAKLIAD